MILNMKTSIVRTLLFAFIVTFSTQMVAQCPMCKIGAESNLKSGGTAGSGLNAGILYMLAMPYLLVGSIGFYWYKNRKKDSELPGA